jgi:hypothetical protein
VLLAVALGAGCVQSPPPEATRVEDARSRSSSSILAAAVAEGDSEVDVAGASGIVGQPAFDASGTRKVWVRRLEGSVFTELVVAEWIDAAWVEEVRIVGRSNPDRPTIDSEGNTVAFVSGVSGLASVYVVAFDGSTDPMQLTNVGLADLRRSPGSPPDGFVAPPIDDSLQFDGDWLTWNGPTAPLAVQWRW